MKNHRKTLIYLFLIFHLLHFIGALYIDAKQDDLGFLLSIKGYLPWMKYFALSGLVLFLVAYIVIMRDTRLLRKSVEQAKEEHTTLKAKLFDFQEASKKSETSMATSTSAGASEMEPHENEDADDSKDSEANPA
jgi:hypothetical protein